jgi:hypothetical protein
MYIYNIKDGNEVKQTGKILIEWIVLIISHSPTPFLDLYSKPFSFDD